jgi:hypothetical protein
VYELLERLNKDGIYDVTKESILMDEMPPFDVTITMENEYGNQSCLSIRGIIIVDEGQVMSIEDMITENTMSFMAEGIEVLRTGGPSTSSSDTTSSGTVTDKMEPPGGPCTYTLDNGDTRFQFDKGKGAYSTEIILMKDKYDSKDTLTYNTQGEEVIMDNLKRDTKYFIKMRSKDKSGSMVSAWTTTEWWFVTSYTPGQPTNPSTVYIDKSGSKYARISYTKGNYSMKEQVSFAHGVFGTLSFKSCDDTPDADNVSGQSYFEIGPLTPGDHYYFKMRGVDSDNICSAWTTDPYNFTAPS